VAGYVGAKAVDALEALYQIAKAKNAGKAAIELLKSAKTGEEAASAIEETATMLTTATEKAAGIVRRSAAQKRAFLKQLADDSKTPRTFMLAAGQGRPTR